MEDQNQDEGEGAMSHFKRRAKELLHRSKAQGEPGTKQPDHAELQMDTQDTLNVLAEARSNLGTETMGPSGDRAQESGNPHRVPPEHRKSSQGPMQTASANIAAGHLAAAESAILSQASAESQIQSDPRHERDQKVFELARTGKLAGIAPSESETALAAGDTEGAVKSAPKTPEEQVAQDMPRLIEAEKRAGRPLTAAADATRKEETGNVEPGNVDRSNTVKTRSSPVEPGEQEGAPRNNLEASARAGKTIGGAEGEAQDRAKQGAATPDTSNIIK